MLYIKLEHQPSYQQSHKLHVKPHEDATHLNQLNEVL